MKIGKNTAVTLEQRVAAADGSVIDEGKDPVRYLHGGYDDIFAKLEQALDGKGVGDTIRVRLDPADAFGDYEAALVLVETVEAFDAPPSVGTVVERQDAGGVVIFRVTEVGDGKVVLDGNHPLAGLTLDFAATVTDVRRATADEIAAKRKARTPAAVAAAGPTVGARIQSVLAGLLFGFDCRYRSEAHRLCALGPIYFLPIAAYAVWDEQSPGAMIAVVVAWALWARVGGILIAKAVDRWGETFLFFDFSPNRQPSRSERILARTGLVAPIVLGLLAVAAGLFTGDIWGGLGVGALVAIVLSLIGAIMLPFLIMVLTGFRLRPVIDEPSGGSAAQAPRQAG